MYIACVINHHPHRIRHSEAQPLQVPYFLEQRDDLGIKCHAQVQCITGVVMASFGIPLAPPLPLPPLPPPLLLLPPHPLYLTILALTILSPLPAVIAAAAAAGRAGSYESPAHLHR